MTTIRAAQASAHGIRSLQRSKLRVKTLQEYHAIDGAERKRAEECDAISELKVGG